MIFSRDGMVFMSFSIEGWGNFHLAKIQPNANGPLGRYEELPKDHPWRALIQKVSEESIDLAVSGHPKPLLDFGIRDAKAVLRLLGKEDECSERGFCLTYKSGKCSIRAKGETPECFTYEGLTELEDSLFKAWLRGYSVISV